jgi:hypothetical protein
VITLKRGLAAVFVVVAAATVPACLRTPPVHEPPRATRLIGWLHTDGTRIVDGAGRIVRLQGIDIASMARGIGEPGDRGLALTGCRGWDAPTPGLLDDIRGWGFNSVRLAISWSNLEPTAPTLGAGGPRHTYNQAYLSAVDGIVAGLRERGVVVVLEMAQAQWSPAYTNVPTLHGPKCAGVGMPRWLYPDPSSVTQTQARLSFFADRDDVQQGYLDVWAMVAAHFADDPTVVALDMFNEPYTQGGFAPSRTHLGALYQRVGGAIRAVNANALLMFQDTNDNGRGTFALDAPPPFAGVVYSFHLYVPSWEAEGLPRMKAYAERAARWDVPLYVGEFDAFGYSSPYTVGPAWHADLDRMFAYCRDRSISWNLFTASSGWFLQPGSNEPRPGLLPAIRNDFAPSPPSTMPTT